MDDILNCTPAEWCAKETQYWQALHKEAVWNKIPLLNVNELHNLKNMRLVRFRGMIQDMHGPEYYSEKFEVINEDTKQISTRNGKYTDIVIQPNETINENGFSWTKERQSYVVISIPALNPWVRKLEEDQNSIPNPPKRPTLSDRKKRELETDVSLGHNGDSNKRPRVSTTGEASSGLSKEYLLNFPLPDPKGKVCHLKVYKDWDRLKLNTLGEFVGFLSVDPALATAQDDEEMHDLEFQVRNPPTSLIPRVHCISFKPLTHSNPLVRDRMSAEKMQSVRKELMILLTQVLCGDELAAEYVLFHLVAKIYVRPELMVLGKFSLNVSHVPRIKDIDFVQEVYKFIEILVPKSHYLGMSLDNMNSLSFVPAKDEMSNRLVSGMLQLSDGTHLVVDETKLSAGKFNETALQGVKTMAHMIQHQKMKCDFTYYPIEYDCDIPFLIFSEGKSMLPSDTHVILKPDDMNLKTYPHVLEAARHFLKPALLDEIRIYLTCARLGVCDIPPEVRTKIQNDFATMRMYGVLTSAGELNDLLVLARFVALSEGKAILDEDAWEKTCALEAERKKRFKTPK